MSNSWPSGVGRLVLPEVDSTNAQAARMAQDLSGPYWIMALRQTKGRGRRGRDWHDPQGNFAATYVSRPGGAVEQVAQRSFVAALAVHDALVDVTARPGSFALKWPNDVLLNGGKLVGILLESIGQGAQVGHLAVGIGVNLLHAPEGEGGALRPVSLLSETGISVTPDEFLDALAPAFAKWENQLVTFGFAPIRQAWLNKAARLGERIVARTVHDSHEGTFEGIDATGALLLRTAQGRRIIPAADVFF
ncbi:biotin--[acetyl-CoA-carboxylase] ligase [Roseinatronobacter sp. NSM]|uniref:biotin--[acetyl-CoA-carboxylase] ligase n=1 Tax=Roseinatronobacter sp. NSM TaxID=3457785 RepID=UPI004036FF89